jgi:hypothetical protein
MSNIIGFLENAGSNAAMRNATRQQLLQVMEHEETERSVLDSLFGARETMYCALQKIKPPKKKKPTKKTPAKKVPAKKPAKKAPAKKK